MPDETPASPGYVASLHALADQLAAGVQERLELLSLEVREEKLRLLQNFIWLSAAVFVGAMALAFASLTVVFLFWPSARLAVLGGFTLLYAGAFVAVVLSFRRYLARVPQPFATTLRELKEDRACIRPQS